MEQVEVHRVPRRAAFFGIEVCHLVKVMASMSVNPGELEGGRVGSKPEEQVLVEGGNVDGRGPRSFAICSYAICTSCQCI